MEESHVNEGEVTNGDDAEAETVADDNVHRLLGSRREKGKLQPTDMDIDMQSPGALHDSSIDRSFVESVDSSNSNHPLLKTPSASTRRHTDLNSQISHSKESVTPSSSLRAAAAAAAMSPDSSWGPVETTPGVFQKFDELEMQWSVQSSRHSHSRSNGDEFETESSISFKSTSGSLASSLGPTVSNRKQFTVVGGPLSPDHGKTPSRPRPRGGFYKAEGRPGESVFDRLYNHARAKQAETAQSLQQKSRSASKSKPSSVGATTMSSRSLASAKTTNSTESVFERLYAQRPSKQHSRSKTDWIVKDLSPAESLERRLAYTPPSKPKSRSSGNRSNNSTRSNISVRSAPTSVYERLYRNEPRKTPVMVMHDRKAPSNRRQRARVATDSNSSTPPANANAYEHENESKNEPSPVAAEEEIVTSGPVNRSVRTTAHDDAEEPLEPLQLQLQLSYPSPATSGSLRYESCESASSASSLASTPNLTTSVHKHNESQPKPRGGGVVHEPPDDGLSTESRSTAASNTTAKAGVPERHGENENGVSPSIAPDEVMVTASVLQDISMLSYDFEVLESLEQVVSTDRLDTRAIQIQRAWANGRTRRLCIGHRTSVAVIQSCWRRYRARARARAVLKNRHKLETQNHLDNRRHLEKQSQRAPRSEQTKLQTLQQERVTVQIQTRWRACRNRRKYYALCVSVGRVQTQWRASCLRRKYEGMRMSAIIVQSVYRGHQYRFAQVRRNNQVQDIHGIATALDTFDVATVRIQAWWRMASAIFSYRSVRVCTIMLQAVCRSFIARQCCKRLRLASSFNQKLSNDSISQTERQDRSVITIQSIWRFFSARTKYDALKKSVLVDQSHAATTIQSACRLFVYFIQHRVRSDAAATLQTVWRALSARKEYAYRRKLAVMIQSSYRGHQSYQAYKELQHLRDTVTARHLMKEKSRVAAVRIQTWWRMASAVLSYRSMRVCTIVLQAVCRGCTTRQYCKRMRLASSFKLLQTNDAMRKRQRQKCSSVMIQSVWRAFAARTKYNAIKKSVLADQSHAATAIQSVWRLYAYFILQRYFIKVRSDAAASIQTVWRAFSARKEYAYRRTLAVMIQSSYRGHQSYQAYKEVRASSVTVQRHVKGYRARSRLRSRVQHLRDTATARHQLTMHSGAATVRIQAWWRMTSAVFSYRSMRVCTTVLQGVCRGFMARQYCKRLRLASSLKLLQTNDAMRKYQRQKCSAVMIQSVWRAYTARREFEILTKCIGVVRSYAALTIQSVWRAFNARREYEALRRCVDMVQSYAATTIQSVWRAFRARGKYHGRRKSVVVIQSLYRGLQSRQVSSVTVQRHVKGFCSRVRYLHDSVTERHPLTAKADVVTVRIQTWWRMTSAVFSYRSVRVCTIMLQAVCRSFMARQHCKHLRLGPPLNQKLSNDSSLQTEQQDRAAVIIQSGWKGASSRREYDALMNCVVIIQSLSRGHQFRQAYRKLRGQSSLTHFRSHDPNINRARSVRQTLTMNFDAAAIRIQAWRRMSSTVTTYQYIRMCAIVLQTVCRAFMARQHRKHPRLTSPLNQLQKNNAMLKSELHNQATVGIQSVWRAHTGRSKYDALRICVVGYHARPNVSAIAKDKDSITMAKSRHLVGQQFASARSIQNAWREYSRYCFIKVHRETMSVRLHAYLRGALFRKRYMQSLALITKMQSMVRGKLGRSALSYWLHVTVPRCQAMARGKVARAWYSAVYSLSLKIQYLFRRRRRLATSHYAARSLQSCWRGSKRRFAYRKTRLSVTVLQAIIRGKLSRQRHNSMKVACLRIQSAVRGYKERSLYGSFASAAILIQKYVRRAFCRTLYIRSRGSVTLIQTMVRTKRLRTRYLSMRSACLFLQSLIRGHIERMHLTRSRTACIYVQRCWRGIYVRSSRAQSDTSVVLLQALVRGCQARAAVETNRILYIRSRGSANLIQTMVRTKILRTRYLSMRCACLLLQSLIRGHIGRMQLTRSRAACICVQRYWRGIAMRSSRAQSEILVVLLQALVRGCRARADVKTSRILFIRSRGSATMIQAMVRTKKLRMRYMSMRCACLLLQSLIRGHIGRMQRTRSRAAATLIQKNARGASCRTSYSQSRASAVMVQTLARGMIALRRYTSVKVACVRIQSAVRSYRMRVLSGSFATGATLIQKIARGASYRTFYIRSRVSAVMVQTLARGVIALRRYTSVKIACVRIQSAVRGYNARSLCVSFATAATFIQKYVRGASCRTFYIRSRVSAVMVQTLTRGVIALRRYTSVKIACVRIQSAVRGYHARSLCVSFTTAATFIQKFVRGASCRTFYIRSRCSTTLIQGMVRTRILRTRYLSMRSACLLLQSLIRGHIERMHLTRSRTACIYVQRCWRGIYVRSSHAQSEISVVLLQALVRGYRARAAVETSRILYIRSRGSATLIQAMVRTKILRTRYMSMRCACLLLQSLIRGHIGRMQLTRSRAACICVQRYWRGIAMRSSRAQSEILVVLLQALVRGCRARSDVKAKRKTCDPMYCAAVKLQAQLRLLPHQRRFRQMKEAASKIQKAFFVWEMQLELLKLESSVILLQRILKGDLGRSATKFALLQINSALQSRTLASFARIVVANDDASAASLLHAWERMMVKAMNYTSIVVQRKFLRHRSRAPLDVRIMNRDLLRIRHRAAILIQLTFICFLLKQKIAADVDAATSLQRWWRADYLSRHFTFGRSPVAVKVIQQLDQRRALVELCPKTYTVQHQATRVLQDFARETSRRNTERQSKLQKRETIRIVARAEKEANDRVIRLLDDSPVAMEEEGPCIHRIAGNVQKARSRSSAAATLASPPLFRSLDIETFLSPIKPIPNGWDELESIPDGWDDDDDLLEGL